MRSIQTQQSVTPLNLPPIPGQQQPLISNPPSLLPPLPFDAEPSSSSPAVQPTPSPRREWLSTHVSLVGIPRRSFQTYLSIEVGVLGLMDPSLRLGSGFYAGFGSGVVSRYFDVGVKILLGLGSVPLETLSRFDVTDLYYQRLSTSRGGKTGYVLKDGKPASTSSKSTEAIGSTFVSPSLQVLFGNPWVKVGPAIGLAVFSSVESTTPRLYGVFGAAIKLRVLPTKDLFLTLAFNYLPLFASKSSSSNDNCEVPQSFVIEESDPLSSLSQAFSGCSDVRLSPNGDIKLLTRFVKPSGPNMFGGTLGLQGNF